MEKVNLLHICNQIAKKWLPHARTEFSETAELVNELLTTEIRLSSAKEKRLRDLLNNLFEIITRRPHRRKHKIFPISKLHSSDSLHHLGEASPQEAFDDAIESDPRKPKRSSHTFSIDHERLLPTLEQDQFASEALQAHLGTHPAFASFAEFAKSETYCSTATAYKRRQKELFQPIQNQRQAFFNS